MLERVRLELARRHADFSKADFTALDPEMTEAIGVLTRNADTPFKLVFEYSKGLLAARPSLLDAPDIAQWLSTEITQRLVREAARDLIAQRPIEQARGEALRFFEGFDGPSGPDDAGDAFDYAVAFVTLSLTRHLSVGDKLMLSRLNDVVAGLDSQSMSPLARGLVDEEIERRGEHIRRGRLFEDFETATEAARLAQRLTDGDLRGGSNEMRGRMLAQCARWQVTTGAREDIDALLATAERLGPSEDAQIARAFLDAKESWQSGLARLSPVDTVARQSAALRIVASRRTPAETMAWFVETGLAPDDLDADGRHILLNHRLALGDWEDARTDALSLSDAQFAETPALLAPAALARLGFATPADLRAMILNGMPLDAATFRLADHETAMTERRAAQSWFGKASQEARALGCAGAARHFETMALWLALRDPASAAGARSRLESLLSDAGQAIAYLPLGLAFGVTLDHAEIERALDRRAALEPEGSFETALARLTLANAKDDPAEAAASLARHRALLHRHLARPGIAEIEIRVLMAAGQRDAAGALLRNEQEHLDPHARRRLEILLAQDAEGPSLANLEAAYEDDPSTIQLSNLVAGLARDGFSPRFFTLAKRLVTTTRTKGEAEMLVQFLLRHDRHDEVAEVLAEIPDVVASSPDLRCSLAWSHYRRGALASAWEMVEALRTERDDANDRSLVVNILVTAGRWPELSGFVDGEWRRRDERSAGELLSAAQLAAQTGSIHALGLLRLAAERGTEDAEIQLGCYLLAIRLGREDELDAYHWFERAAALSGENGPVQSGSLEEVMARQGDWELHVETVFDHIRAGEAPISVAAKAMRRSTLELVLTPILANRHQPDARRRALVSAFSGAREPAPRDAVTLGLDGCAAVTLGLAGMLEAVIARPGGVWIPHELMNWLFTERQALGFHQPSRIKAAHELTRALAADRLSKFTPTMAPDGVLEAQIGIGLAAMLASAADVEKDGPQRLVVRSAPVHKIGSFRGESVPLEAYVDRLCSCEAVLDKVAAAGLLTHDEEDRARAYLRRQETRWPGEPEVADGAHLYLDELSVAYFQTTKLLDKLKAAGVVAFVSARSIREAEALVELESMAGEIEAAIEAIRAPLAQGLADGQVRLNGMTRHDEDFDADPNLAAIQLAAKVDAIVSDDRYMNRHTQMEYAEVTAAIWSSLDVLELLKDEGVLGAEEVWRHRTAMRRDGMAIVPVDKDELVQQIELAAVRDGVLVETGELRGLRENLRLLQQRRWLRLPLEQYWFNAFSTTIAAAIRAQWRDDLDDGVARARSRWLLELADLRNWAGAVSEGNAANLARLGAAIPLQGLMLTRLQIGSTAAIERMDKWIEVEVHALRDTDRPAYDWLIGNLRAAMKEGLGDAG